MVIFFIMIIKILNHDSHADHDKQDDHDQRARVSDSGAYMCQPSVGGPAGAMVHVIRGGSMRIGVILILIMIVMIVMEESVCSQLQINYCDHDMISKNTI